MFNPPFPWHPENLSELKKRLKDPENKVLQINWYWEPFHRPGFEALKYANNHAMTAELFAEKLKDLSCPQPPRWLDSKIKNKMSANGVIGKDGELAPLDPQKLIQRTFETANFQIKTFGEAILPCISELKFFLDQSSLDWKPDLENLVEVTDLSKWLTHFPDLLKTFHSLKVWDKLEFLESMMGLFKSSSILNFTRIYSL